MPSDPSANLASGELQRRVSRPPDHRAENEALRTLANALAREPEGFLERLVESAMRLCGAESAAISVIEEAPPLGSSLRWHAAAGRFAEFRGRAFPLEQTLGSVALERQETVLVLRPGEVFPAIAVAAPPVVEALVTPVFEGDRPLGALWVAGHGRARPFDGEDRRLLESLAGLAAASWRAQAGQASARESAAFLRLVTDHLPVQVAYVDREFRFRFMNDAYERLSGLSREAALGRTIREAASESVFEAVRTNLTRALAGETHTQEIVVPYHGRTRTVQCAYVPDFAESGETRGVVVQILDLTERRAAEAALREKESRYRSLFNSIDEGFCVVEMLFDAAGNPIDYRFKEINAAFEKQTGICPADVAAGRTMRQIAPAHEAYWFEIYGRVARTGEPARFENPAEALGRFYEVHAFRLGDEANAEVGILFTDITVRTLQERALAEARGRLDAVLAAAEIGVWDYDPATGRIGGDANLGAMFGLDAETARHAPAESFIARIHPDDQAGVAEAFGRAATEGTPYNIEYRTVVGDRTRHLIARGFAEQDAEGKVVRMPGAVLDVSDVASAQAREREAIETLVRSQETFRTVFEQAPDDAIVVMDLDRTIAAWNPAAERICGWSAGEAIGRLGDFIFTPEDLAQGLPIQEAATADRDGKAVDERWHMRKDGSRFWGSGTMNSLHDGEGNVRGYLKVFRDATEVREVQERLQAAVEERTAELRRTVQEAEGFNYSISHDLRAPLRAMVATSSILLEDLGDRLADEHREMLERQAHNAKRLGRLIDELLRLSRFARVEVKREPLDLTRKAWIVFDEMREHGQTNGCRMEVQSGMVAEGDAGLVRTVYENLIGNACKFSPEGGTVRAGQTGDTFWVRDEGVGFDMAFAPKVFLPFERLVTEREFEGTGIGLANVKRIVERHGGRVWVESEPGVGTTFSFTLGASS